MFLKLFFIQRNKEERRNLKMSECNESTQKRKFVLHIFCMIKKKESNLKY